MTNAKEIEMAVTGWVQLRDGERAIEYEARVNALVGKILATNNSKAKAVLYELFSRIISNQSNTLASLARVMAANITPGCPDHTFFTLLAERVDKAIDSSIEETKQRESELINDKVERLLGAIFGPGAVKRISPVVDDDVDEGMPSSPDCTNVLNVKIGEWDTQEGFRYQAIAFFGDAAMLGATYTTEVYGSQCETLAALFGYLVGIKLDTCCVRILGTNRLSPTTPPNRSTIG